MFLWLYLTSSSFMFILYGHCTCTSLLYTYTTLLLIVHAAYIRVLYSHPWTLSVANIMLEPYTGTNRTDYLLYSCLRHMTTGFHLPLQLGSLSVCPYSFHIEGFFIILYAKANSKVFAVYQMFWQLPTALCLLTEAMYVVCVSSKYTSHAI